MANAFPDSLAPSKKVSTISFWYQLGPLFLLGAAAALFLKFNLFDSAIFSLAFFGIFAIHKWDRLGFFAACLLLMVGVSVFFYLGKTGPASFALFGCIGCSWWLNLLGRKMAAGILLVDEEKFAQLEGSCKDLERELSNVASKRAEEMRAHSKEREALQQELAAVFVEREKSAQRMADLEEAIAVSLAKEADLQLLLAAQQYHRVSREVALQEEDSDEKMCLEQLQYQHALLREQFEEKSDVLHRTRRELFLLETELFSLQKQRELEACEELHVETYEQVGKMSHELDALEAHAARLQELISSLVVEEKSEEKKMRKPRKTKAKKEEEQGFPFILQSLSLN